jgi:hypothetical protein
MPKIKDLTGKTFGQLTVIRFDKIHNNHSYWICRCSCGREKSVMGTNLIRRYPKKCYCGNSVNPKFYPKEYYAWCHIKRRCYKAYDKGYKYYGARGIQVCEQWLNSFDTFLKDVGPAPSPKHSIERDDVNGNYEPGNCRWATPTEQANNTTRTVYIEYNGQKKPLRYWCDELGMPYECVRQKLWKDGDVEKAFSFYLSVNRGICVNSD